MKKKMTALLLAVMLLLSMTACGSPADEAPAPAQAEPAAQNTPAPAPAPAAPVEEPAEPEPAAEPEPEPEPEVIEEPVEEPEAPAEMDPEMVAFLDAYEAFVDEYCEFMEAYTNNPTDLNLLMKMAGMLEEYGKFAEEVEEYDTESLTEAELLYYTEVYLRCSEKLLKCIG